MADEKTSSEGSSLDEKISGGGKPDLEKIATMLANWEEDHKVDQLIPAVMEAFVTAPGVKYKDENGVEHYKTKFTAEEALKLADRLFDKIVYHAHLRRYNMTPEFFEQLKGVKDAYGNPLAEAEVERAFGITRVGLRRTLLRVRNNLTTDALVDLAKHMLRTHEKHVKGKIYQELTEEHKDYVAKFLKDKIEKHGLKGREYFLEDKHTLEELLPVYESVATTLYKKKK